LSSSGCQMPAGLVFGADMNKEVYGVDWLTGSWSGGSAETQTEEHWTSAKGGTMVGMGRTVSGGKTVFFEYLRIEERGGDLYYIASPKGAADETEFKLVESTPNKAVFENKQHGFPQRIIYERHGDDLHARIEGLVNGRLQAEDWTWHRAQG
ncbi:MAG TPA: DUF6265 family protein, partial [Phycisphaerales bacterium]|nr:DUF6265 family protein [Phycisphaerales bacterium]